MGELKRPGLVVALGVLVGLASPGEALIIDDFDTPPGGHFVCEGPAISSSASTFGSVAAVGALGGHREFLVDRTGGTHTVSLGANVGGSGTLTFASGSGTTGTGQVQWDGADATSAVDTDGLGSVDLTSGGNSAIFVRASADLTGGTMTVTVYDFTTGSSCAALPVALTSGLGFVDYLIPLASFPRGVNFTTIGAITLDITGSATLRREG